MVKQYKTYKESGIEWIGEIPQDWIVSKIRYYTSSVKTGKTPPTENELYFQNGDINWFGPGDFKSLELDESNRKITIKAVEELGLELYPRNTILLIGIGATLGKVGIIKTQGFSNQQVNAIIFNDLVEPKYGLYFFDVFKEITINEANASTMAILNQSKTKDLKLLIPPIFEQHSIVNYLDHQANIIDQLIGKKQKLIELLKEKRQAIINEAVTKGLNPNVKMKESGIEWLGEIPEEYRLIKIKSLLMSGKILQQDGNHGELHPTADDYVEEGIPFIMANNVTQGMVDVVNCRFLSNSVTEKLRIGFAKEGDILLTHKGTVGRTAIVPKLTTPYIMLTPQVTYYRVLAQDLSKEYLELVFQSDFFQIQLKVTGSEGSTRSYVGLLNQKDLKLILPEYDTQLIILKKISIQVNEFDKLVFLSFKQIQKLKEFRQSIISEAVTGKIDVRDWQPNTENN